MKSGHVLKNISKDAIIYYTTWLFISSFSSTKYLSIPFSLLHDHKINVNIVTLKNLITSAELYILLDLTNHCHKQ